MKIVAHHDLGELGAKEDRPAVIQWSWYDSKPTLPLWVVLLTLLVVPQQNRKWQVWLILVVPLVALTFRWLLPIQSAQVDLMLQWIVTFTIAWTSVWLLAPYSNSRSRLATFGSSLAVMFGVGIVGYLGYFGLWYDSDTTIPTLIFWGIGSVFLLLALTLSGVCSRRRFHAGIIAAWLMLWLPLLTAIGMVVTILSVNVIVGGMNDFASLVMIVPAVAIGSLMVSGFLYVVNLPVLLLAGLTDDYRERLQAMIYRDSAVHPSVAEGNPFGE